MGKKSKNPNKKKAAVTNIQASSSSPSTTATSTTTDPGARSDGPSEEEINAYQTTSRSLQAKLDQLTNLAIANDRRGFVEQFVPTDLSEADINGYLNDLTTAPEAEGQWRNLISEIVAIAAGRNVNRIEGDQVTRAVFFFQHPLLEGCDREVAFICRNGEWRAEG